MVEEKKEQNLEGQTSPQPSETIQEKVEGKIETPQTASASSEQEKKEEKKKDVKTTKEKPSNCASCNKSIRKKRWYYRNGKYYCTKRCWKATIKKEDKTSEAPDKK